MSESKPTLRREQIAGMNIHYIMWSLDYFLDVQQRLGFESIELWCAEPHVTLDHTGYFEAEVLAKKAADRGLRYRTLCPENVVYPWQYCARKPLHEQRSLAYFKHGIELAEVLGCDRMSINSDAIQQCRILILQHGLLCIQQVRTTIKQLSNIFQP